jgi:hypothetical protein
VHSLRAAAPELQGTLEKKLRKAAEMRFFFGIIIAAQE